MHLRNSSAVSSMRSTILTPKGQLGSQLPHPMQSEAFLSKGEVILADTRGNLVPRKREVRKLVHRGDVDAHHVKADSARSTRALAEIKALRSGAAAAMVAAKSRARRRSHSLVARASCTSATVLYPLRTDATAGRVRRSECTARA